MLLSLAVRAWLGSMFLYSAGLKLTRYDRAGVSVRAYDILPKPIATAAGYALPWAELATAASLFLGRLYPLGPVLGASLGTSFAYGSFSTLQRKADVPCGCVGKSGDLVDHTTLGRALAIVVANLLLLRDRHCNGAPLPSGMLVVTSCASVLPAGLTLNQRRRHARLHKQRAQRAKRMVAQATQLLAALPSAPLREVPLVGNPPDKLPAKH